MSTILLFDNCLQFIEKNKGKNLFSNEPALKLAAVDPNAKDKIWTAVAPAGTEQIVIVPSEGRFRILSFKKGRFLQEAVAGSVQKLAGGKYQVSCYQSNTKAFVAWVEEQFLEEEVKISRQDAQVLKEHQIVVPPSRKATRRYLKDAGQKALASQEQSKVGEKSKPGTPVIKDPKVLATIVQKYCQKAAKEDTIALELEEILQQDAVVEVEDRHSQVFTKYGIAVPKKGTYKEVQDSLRKSLSDQKLLKTISAEDLAVFRKYGIKLSATGEVKGRIKLPQTTAGKIKAALTLLLFLGLLGGGIWHFFGDKLRPLLEREKTKFDANLGLRSLKEYVRRLQDESGLAANLHKTVVADYPPQQDYLEPHPRLLRVIRITADKIPYWEVQVAQGEKIFQAGKFLEAREFFQQQQAYIANHPEELQTIERVRRNLETLRTINQHLKNELEREHRVQKVLSTLRQAILNGGEWLDLIEEKQTILARRAGKEPISIEPKLPEILQAARRKMDQLEHAVQEIEGALLVDYKRAEPLAEQYSQLPTTELEKLRAIDENYTEILRGFEKLDSRTQLRLAVNQTMAEMNQRVSELKKSLDTAEDRLAAAKKLPPDPELPQLDAGQQDIVRKADDEIKTWRNLMSKATQLVDDNKFEEAQTLLGQEYKASKSVLPELARVSENLAELLQRAQTLKIEKSARAVQVSKSLAEIKRATGNLGKSLTGLPEEIFVLSKEFNTSPEFVARLSKYEASVKAAQSLQTAAGKLVKDVEEKLAQQKLAEAQQLLEKSVAESDKLRKAGMEMDSLRGEMAKSAAAVRQDRQRQQKLDTCNRMVAKMEKYTQRLQDILSPIESEMGRLAKNFPPAEGYPQPTATGQEALVKAKKNLDTIGQLRLKARNLLDKNQLDDAYLLLQPYEGKSLSGPTLASEVKALQAEVTQLLQQAEVIKKGKSKAGQNETLLMEIRTRHDNLRNAIAKLEKNLQILQTQYGSLQQAQNLLKYAGKYVGDGKEELRSLADLIAIAERYLKEQRYNSAMELLKPFSDAESRGHSISLLPAIQTFVTNSEKILQSLQDPRERARLEASAQAEKDRRERLQKLTRAPGNWYTELSRILDKYDTLKPQMEGAVKEGIRIVLSTIEGQTKTIREYPQDIAQIDDILFILQQQGHKFTEDPNSRRAKQLSNYIKTKSIEVDLQEEIAELSRSVGKLQEELRLGGWVDEETLRAALRSLKAIDRKYREISQDIKGPLETLEAQIPH